MSGNTKCVAAAFGLRVGENQAMPRYQGWEGNFRILSDWLKYMSWEKVWNELIYSASSNPPFRGSKV